GGYRRGGTRAMIANWPLIGRREELSLIERTLSDGQFRGLLLAGAPGVGKTRLAREALTAAEAAGSFTRWAAASRGGRDSVRCSRAPVATHWGQFNPFAGSAAGREMDG